MKKQSLVIISVFILLMTLFYIFKTVSFDDVVEVQALSEEDSLASEDGYVVIHISGEVNKSGYFKVPNDWTVGMLLNYVGLGEDANISMLELEALVEDGYTYNVTNKSYGEVSNKININTASIEELKTLKGIGDSIANKIILYRQHTPFKSIEDIKNVDGIGDALYEKIKDFITV